MALFLLGFGLLILLSASSAYALHSRQSMYSIFMIQFAKAALGVILMILFSAVPYEFYKKYTKYGILLITFILILTRTVMPPLNNAHRWFNLGFFSFQPAEFAKLLLIMHVAKMIEDKQEVLKDFDAGFRYILFWVVVVAGLIISQPNVSNAVIILMLSFAMLFVAGARLKHLFGSAFGVGLSATAIAFVLPHSQKRIMTFFSSTFNGGDFHMQIQQAIIGLGSGGFHGLGLGNSQQRNFHLPEAYGDFIFAIIGEETGLIGTIIILLSFLFLFLIGIVIAKNAKDTFGKLLGFGIASSFLLNAIIHIAVSSGVIPATGITLPFISYGGTSLLVLCISVGMLMNIGFSNKPEVLPEAAKANPNE